MGFELIRTILAGVFIVFGLILFVIEVFGVNKFNFVMNRMHAAAIGDTLAMMSCMLGLIIYSGFNFTSLKLLLVTVFLCFSSPVSSHLIMNLEVETNDKVSSHYAEVFIPDEIDGAEIISRDECPDLSDLLIISKQDAEEDNNKDKNMDKEGTL